MVELSTETATSVIGIGVGLAATIAQVVAGRQLAQIENDTVPLAAVALPIIGSGIATLLITSTTVPQASKPMVTPESQLVSITG